MQSQSPISAGTNSVASASSGGYYVQRRRPDQQQQAQPQQSPGSSTSSSTGMLSLCPVSLAGARVLEQKGWKLLQGKIISLLRNYNALDI